MVKLGFSLQAQYDCPQEQVIALLRQAGFSAVSPVWAQDLDMDTLAACVRENGMTIQSLHAPHGVYLLWEPDHPDSASVQDRIIGCIDACARYQVPVMVIHGWQGLQYTFPDTPLDFRFFDRMVDHAQRKNVSIAFENLEGEEYLAALLNRYRNRSHIGFCWDSGHDHCYPHKTDFLKSYGDRLIMTHLNDNLGLRSPDGIPAATDDLHFLPYDGSIQWKLAMGRLKNLPAQSILNFEIKKRSKSTAPGDLLYDPLSPEEFFRLAGQRARRIAQLYETMAAESTSGHLFGR